MTKSPYLNAISAAAYIVVVASIMFYGPQLHSERPSVLVPIAVLSLFVLSAAVMASIFFYQPVRMYLDGQMQQAVSLAVKTIGVFACITLLFLVSLFAFTI